MKRIWIALLLPTLVPALSRAANRPVIEKIQQPEGRPGQKPGILLQKGLKVREVGEGDEVQPTERVRTDGQTTVTLKYPDDSRLDVGPNSDLEIEKVKNGVQSSLLHGGYVQGEVQKSPNLIAGRKPKIHFLIRTKAAVMGVRGTQFVAALDALQGVAEFHTLEGTVEVAQSVSSLTAAQGVTVGASQFVAANSATGITAVQSFSAPTFLSSLASTSGLQTVVASAASSVGASAASGAAGAANRNSSAPPSGPSGPPPALPPPAAPPRSPEQEAKEKQAKEEEDKTSPRFHPLNFQAAFLYAEEPNVPGTEKVRHRALQLAFTPYFPLPIPYFKWLYFRGFVGATLWEDASLYNGILTRDAQVFVGVTLLRPLFAEVGAGIQNWAKLGRDAAQVSVNVGLVLNENKFFNRLFIGATGAHFGDQKGSLSDAQWIGEIRAGIGFQF